MVLQEVAKGAKVLLNTLFALIVQVHIFFHIGSLNIVWIIIFSIRTLL